VYPQLGEIAVEEEVVLQHRLMGFAESADTCDVALLAARSVSGGDLFIGGV
jgi:hypothetical protein